MDRIKLKRKRYLIKKKFYLTKQDNLEIEIRTTTRRRGSNEGGYRIGATYYDYVGSGYELARITNLLLERGFIESI